MSTVLNSAVISSAALDSTAQADSMSDIITPIPFPIPHPVPPPAPAPAALIPTELIGGLGAAIGCAFRRNANQLVFVEYAGKLSTYDLFPAATIPSQGTAILKGTFHFDLDAGVEANPGYPTDPAGTSSGTRPWQADPMRPLRRDRACPRPVAPAR